MLAKLFKRNGVPVAREHHPVLDRLTQLDARSAMCTLVQTADGHKTRNEVGPVSFYRRQNRLFTRGHALYLAPPEGFGPDELPFSGRGEVLSLRFYHERTPYSLDCRVIQRVRFSDQLLGRLEPRVPVGYKLAPLSNVRKNEKRGSLRFAHIRGAKGPQVFPNLRFNLFVERAHLHDSANSQPPEVMPYPGDDPVPEEVRACESPEALVALFHHTLAANPQNLQQVHVAKLTHNPKSGKTELLDLGYTPALGLRGKSRGAQIHIRCPQLAAGRRDRTVRHQIHEGDALVIRYLGCGLLRGDTHYRWGCRVLRCGIETLVLRPKGLIRKQTGLPVVVRDFNVSGINIQNSPLLEGYLLDTEAIPGNADAILERLTGTGLLLHFHPRLYYPKDLETFRPRVPAAFSILGEILHGRVDTGKEAGRILDLGVSFRYDPADYDEQTLDVTAWEAHRGMRENPHFKEIHRALNALQAYLER